ncbi:MAG: hypothetical protein E7525_04010 [Ruminococcaceae bacterium]|nr:hypothetical protein [Oscillospiraceae bacterium]
MKETIECKDKNNRRHATWKVLGIFVAVAVLIYGFIFLFNYSIAYDHDTGGGWIPPSFAIIVYYFELAVASIIALVIVKIILKKRVRIWPLLLSAVLIPIICYNFNYRSFKRSGFLYPLVDKGGIFHFMAIGDYNFDGMNDELHHRLYDERERSSRYGGHFNDTIIKYIDTTVVGTGYSLDGFCFYDWETKIIDLHLIKNDIQYKQITIVVAFQDPALAQKVSFYLEGADPTLLNHTVNRDNTVSMVFDADICAKWQNNAEKEFFEIPIRYVIND